MKKILLLSLFLLAGCVQSPPPIQQEYRVIHDIYDSYTDGGRLTIVSLTGDTTVVYYGNQIDTVDRSLANYYRIINIHKKYAKKYFSE